ncbi:MAG TPA: hypothetical protein VHO67_04700 [Polyangia bacterium]|nr:hypothetical protein [Polyangia bacterium]
MTPQQDKPARRWRRWAARLALAFAAVLVLVAVAVAVVLGSLDAPWMKARVQRIARDSAGIDLDYRALKVRLFSGVWLDGLVVATPAPLASLTPELARIDHLEATWSLSSLLGGGPKIRTVVIDGVSVALAQDAAGRTSLDLLGTGPRAPEKPSPPTPLSRLAAKIFSGAAPVGRLDVTRVQAASVRAAADGTVQRDSVRGLQVSLATRPAPGGWAATVGLGSASTPLAVEIARQGPATAAARLALALTANGAPDGFSLATDVRVVSQDLVSVQVSELVHVDAAVKPDPAHGRTAVQLSRLAAADGALVVSLAADVPDAAAGTQVLSVLAADAHVDVAHLLGALPKGTVPASLDGGAVQLHVAHLELVGNTPRLTAGGEARLDVDLPRARLAAPAGTVSVDGVQVGVAATPAPDGRLDARVSLRVADAGATGQTRAAVRGFRLQLRADGLRIDPASPAASTGALKVEGGVASLDLRTPAMRAAVDRLGLRFDATLSGRPPYAANLQIPVEGLRLFDGRGRALFGNPARVALSLSHVQPDAQRPAASRGDLQATIALGPVNASVDAHKRADDVDVDLAVKADTLAAVRPFLPPDLARQVDWDRVSVDLQTKAHAERLSGAAPLLRQETNLRVDGLRAGRSGAHHLALRLRSDGDARRHEADLSLSAEGLALDGRASPDVRLQLTARADRREPSGKLHLDVDGPGHLVLDASAAVAGGSRRLDADVDLKVERLTLGAALRPLLGAEGVDLRRTSARVQAHAALTGLIDRVGRGGEVRLAGDPARTAGGNADLTVHVAELGVVAGATQVALGALDWKVGLRGAAGRRREFSSDLRLAHVRLASGEQKLELAALQDTTAAALTGDPATGPAELTNQLALTGLQQDVAPFFPTEAITLDLAARRQADGLIQLSQVRLTDAKAGTSLVLGGAVDLGTDRRLSVRGRFDQDLARLRPLPQGIAATGRVGLSFDVDSPDLEAFRTHALLTMDRVDLRAPAAGVVVEGADAQIPVDFRVVSGPKGFKIPREARVNPYASLRFIDQEPLQAQSSFLSIARVTTPFVTIAPLAGNLSIDQNVLSLGQLEMGVRGGHVTGQCTLDWRGDDAKLETHIRASGVQSSHGEPFDGDAALVISTGERTIEGRAQILRIGKRHLLDLLDVADPHRTDAAMNRVRHALLLGYPDQVRIAFSHGFASARVTLGGLASLIRIDEIRGIPTGSLLDKVLTPQPKSETE